MKPGQIKPNGCGPDPFNVIIPDGPFKFACNMHDLEFNPPTMSYWQSNINFYKRLYQSCTKWYHWPWATLYGTFVMLFGWIWYYILYRFKK